MYKCKDCTYSSNQPYNLRRHKKAIHQKHVLNQNYFKNRLYSNKSRSHMNGIHNKGELNQNYNNTLY